MTFKHLVMLTALGSTMSAPLLATEMGGKEMGGMNGMSSMGGMTGGVMFEYRYMNMRMDGNRDGTTSLSTSDVTGQGFMMASPEMRMDMHMLMGMYDFSPKWSGMMMLNYLDQEMDMVNAMGAVQPTMKSSGLGDTEVAALYRLDSEKGTDVRFKFGLGLPTGSTDEKGLMMGNPSAILPYPMQLGSGTFDLKPGIEYTRSLTGWKWGAKADLTLRLGRNDEDYSLGNRLDGNLWADKKVASHWALNGALDYAYWGNIDGRDTRINPVMSPYGDPDRQGGQRLDARFGFTYSTEGGTKFGVDYATPIYQDLDGPQMEMERIWSANLQIMF